MKGPVEIVDLGDEFSKTVVVNQEHSRTPGGQIQHVYFGKASSVIPMWVSPSHSKS